MAIKSKGRDIQGQGWKGGLRKAGESRGARRRENEAGKGKGKGKKQMILILSLSLPPSSQLLLYIQTKYHPLCHGIILMPLVFILNSTAEETRCLCKGGDTHHCIVLYFFFLVNIMNCLIFFITSSYFPGR